MDLFYLKREDRYRTVLLDSHPYVRKIYNGRCGLASDVLEWLSENASEERTLFKPGYQISYESAAVAIEFTDSKLATAFKMRWG